MLLLSLFGDEDGRVHITVQNVPTWKIVFQPLTIVWVFAIFAPFINTMLAVTTFVVALWKGIKSIFSGKRKLKGTWYVEEIDELETMHGIGVEDSIERLLIKEVTESLNPKPEFIYLIEKGWIDPMENRIDNGYGIYRFTYDEDEAKEICENGGNYTPKDLWSVSMFKGKVMPKFRYTKIKQLTNEERYK